MVEIKGLGDVRRVGGTKSARKTGQAEATGGASFAEMLDQAAEVTGAEAAAPSLPNLPYAPLASAYDEPGTAKQKASNLLESLTLLADDALAGNPARALADLQAALNANPPDQTTLTPPQQQAMDELATRAAVEVAKRGG